MDAAPGASGRATSTGRGPGRPAVLSRAAIFDAVTGCENVDTVTMRQLAERLGVSHGALYRWVSGRDALFELISETVVDQVLADLADTGPAVEDWRQTLRRLAAAMRRRFLAVPGYSSHLARPHPHHEDAVDRLRATGTAVFRAGGATPRMADQSWLIFLTSVIGWLALEEQAVLPGRVTPRFDLLVGVLLRGLPAQGRDAARGSRRSSSTR